MRGIFEVARREYVGYISAWGFWFGLLITPLSLSLGLILPQMIERSQPQRIYAVVDQGREFADALGDVIETSRAAEVRTMLSVAAAGATREQRGQMLKAYSAALLAGADAEDALVLVGAPEGIEAPPRRLVETEPPARTAEALAPWLSGERKLEGDRANENLFAAFIVHRDEAGRISEVSYWSRDVVSAELPAAARDALREINRKAVLAQAGLADNVLARADLDAPEVIQRKAASGGDSGEVSLADRTPFLVAAALTFLVWALVFSVVNFLIMGTIEERSNKIFDLLLTSVRLPQLLAGKLLGVLALCVTLMGGWAIVGSALLLRTGNAELISIAASALEPKLLLAAGVGFLGGYLIYASIFLAIGSLCETIQEAQTLVSPLIILLMIPLLVVAIAIRAPDSTFLQALAWVPPLTPFLMVLRAPLDPPWWELMGQIGLMTAFALITLWASTRIYRAGAVHGAGIPSFFSFGRRKPAA